MKFSSLVRNEKTFNLLSLYLEEINTNQDCCFTLDNRIQAEEIKNYLREYKFAYDDQQAVQDWIKCKSKEFRTYLNSIKLAAIILLSRGIRAENFHWEQFCEVEKYMNLYKGNCLDTIF